MGAVHIYCGDGKGKTSAALGLALRASGRGIPVVICRFLKNEDSGEVISLANVPGITLIPCGKTFGFSWQMTPEERKEAAEDCLARFEEAVSKALSCSGDGMAVLILDEAMAAVNGGFLPLARLLNFLDSRPDNLEVVLTGRNPAEELLSRAGYVTEMKKIRHVYEEGILARKGIEF